MNNKRFLLQLVVIVIVAGTVSFLASSPFAHANFITDFLNKYFPSLQGNSSQSPSTEKVIQNIQGQQAPYKFSDVHEEAIISAVEQASPSVVSIVISKYLPVIEQCPANPFGDLPPEFQEFFGGGFQFSVPCQKGAELKEVGGGSGFIISADGLILTNKHVVADEKAQYTVLTNDGKKYTAKVLARDPVQDLAVVKIEAAGLKTLKLGNSDAIKLGQTAIAIGNALGEFRNTVSVGVISGLARNITASDQSGKSEILEGLIQTDAAINPGNSGGPLLNLKGEVIGVNTAVASGAQNIGFTIPINKAKRDIISVQQSGRISVAYLGVRYVSVDDSIAEKEKLLVKRGALLRGNQDGPAVMKDSPAFKAGLEAKDVILEIDGRKIDENNSLSSLIQNYQVGDKIKLKILRGDKEIEAGVTLEERKN
ncbi:MAG: hypothetical protein Athens071426_392 [Parcubacteria group bacterium Athens0714_26]|nr:MAG: hypothetical protein Athens101426_132 [Parcubacteria group bacterium Athens1014_26]TSD02784.1 MAG: hypothetical protein Athens071426_392 [Parcubacteria group bacterium Athens0714_26]